MKKITSLIIELIFLNVGLYAFISTYLDNFRGSGGGQLVFLTLWWSLVLSSIFYILIRIGINKKKKIFFFAPIIFYLSLMVVGSSMQFNSLFEGFYILGLIGLLFIALPILILLAIRYLLLKLKS